MSGKHFIDKRPESILDWMAIVCAGIALWGFVYYQFIL